MQEALAAQLPVRTRAVEFAQCADAGLWARISDPLQRDSREPEGENDSRRWESHRRLEAHRA